jgi:hypothetical protein
MRRASKALEKAFFDGIRQDAEMGKHSTRLLRLLSKNRGDVKETMVEIVMAPTIQSGLKWAAENGVLQRSIEALVIKFKDDFDDVDNIDKVAKWRRALVAGKAA